MLISISKENPLEKIWFLEIAFAERICKSLLKPNSRVVSVIFKMGLLVKITCHIRKLPNFNFQVQPSYKRRMSPNSVCAHNL